MNVLYGLLRPDEGQIVVEGRVATIRAPRDALALGIGFVHQRFVLVPSLTVAENVAVGARPGPAGLLRLRDVDAELRRLSERFGLPIDPRAEVAQLSVGEQQRVEILKALYRNARLLVLDEPTAVLTPQETRSLFAVLRSMTATGLTVVLITHKLEEVMDVSDRVTVLRRGHVVGTVSTPQTTPEQLVSMMLGRALGGAGERSASMPGPVRVELDDVAANGDRGSVAVRGISLAVRSGEIVGVAGVAGNGQSELAEVIVGARPVTRGRIRIAGVDVTRLGIEARLALGLVHVPEDASRMGLCPNLTVAENLVLKHHTRPPFGHGLWLDRRAIADHAARMVREFDVRGGGVDAPVRLLSGGNQQRLVLARELGSDASVVVAVQPTRGLDVAATRAVHRRLDEQRSRGRAVLLISAELDEVLGLADRIAVVFAGEIRGVVDGHRATAAEIGLLMGGSRGRVPATG